MLYHVFIHVFIVFHGGQPRSATTFPWRQLLQFCSIHWMIYCDDPGGKDLVNSHLENPRLSCDNV